LELFYLLRKEKRTKKEAQEVHLPTSYNCQILGEKLEIVFQLFYDLAELGLAA